VAGLNPTWRVPTDAAELYEIHDFLTPEECVDLIALIDTNLVASPLTHGPRDYRTSRTHYLPTADHPLISAVDRRICDLVGVPSSHSETLQGQRYDEGQYFRRHTDAFCPKSEIYAKHTAHGGQRTWTVMVYLNKTQLGGQTLFDQLERAFTPRPGTALAWHNLHPDGTLNEATRHEALPVLRGRKYVLTKWFRTSPWSPVDYDTPT
jgi:prolyl 4-hydroxylase